MHFPVHLFNNLDKAQPPSLLSSARINGETRQSLHPEELDANIHLDACAREKSSREPLETSFHTRRASLVSKPIPLICITFDQSRAPPSSLGEGDSSAAKASEKKSNLSFGAARLQSVFQRDIRPATGPYVENVLLAHPFLLDDASDLLISPGRNIEHGGGRAGPRWPFFHLPRDVWGTRRRTEGEGGAATTGVRKV